MGPPDRCIDHVLATHPTEADQPMGVRALADPFSLMSDYQVTLVNNKMNEFFVKFHGPAESECFYASRPKHHPPRDPLFSTRVRL